MRRQSITTGRSHSIAAVLAALAIAAPIATAQAAIFNDAQLESMREAGKYAELEHKAQMRLKANAADAEASAALSLALTFLDVNDGKRVEAGAKQAKQCTEQHPAVALCHVAAAQNLGVQMMNLGMIKAMRMLDTLKLSWGRALELDPGSFVARVELAKLYLTVPGMLGGSVSKAKELEAAVRNSQPETARVIRAYLAGEAKKWAEMEEELLALHPSKDPVVRAEIRGITTQLAQAFYKDGKDMAKAKSLYEALSRSQPTHASGYYGVGRVHLAMGQPDQAVRNLEHARTLAGADDYPIDQRLGDAFLAKGDQPKAKAAYERYIANKRANPANAEEARSSLAKLR